MHLADAFGYLGAATVVVGKNLITVEEASSISLCR